MHYSQLPFVNYLGSIPYKIHPSFHFLVYKTLLSIGFKDVLQDCVVKFMIEHTKSGDCVLDIGANMGTYTYSLSKAVGDNGSVYSFEANPRTVVQLRKNIGNRNVYIENLAVSNEAGEKTFYVHTKGCGPTSSLEYHEQLSLDREIEPTSVKCTTIDEYCDERHIRPNLIKIDVEGHELKVIKGAMSTIDKYRPFLVFEFIEVWWLEKEIYKIFEFLRNGYQLLRLEDGADAEQVYRDYKIPPIKDFRESNVVNIGCIPRMGKPAHLGSID